MPSFASDNNAGVHPRVLAAIEEANRGHAIAYGDDPWTERATELFKRELGERAVVFFVTSGTAANVLSIDSLVRSHHAVLVSDVAHLAVDECGAPERLIGCKLIDIPTPHGKLTADDVKRWHRDIGDPHRVQLKVVSLTQATELGTFYNVDEIRAITDAAHALGIHVHMDGARIANAAASLGVSLGAITHDAGVDVVSFGGTKNGLMFGEAVVFFDASVAKEFAYRRKQAMQLLSKMRFVAAQFIALFTDQLWLENARHANKMAALLAREVKKIPKVNLTHETEANAVFATLPAPIVAELQKLHKFYVWTPETSEVRWMTAFDTKEADVKKFVADISELCAKLST